MADRRPDRGRIGREAAMVELLSHTSTRLGCGIPLMLPTSSRSGSTGPLFDTAISCPSPRVCMHCAVQPILLLSFVSRLLFVGIQSENPLSQLLPSWPLRIVGQPTTKTPSEPEPFPRPLLHNHSRAIRIDLATRGDTIGAVGRGLEHDGSRYHLLEHARTRLRGYDAGDLPVRGP